jgi:hypothetical protein
MWLVHPRVIFSSFDSNILLNWPTLLSGTLGCEGFVADVLDVACDRCTFDLNTDLNCGPVGQYKGRATKYNMELIHLL